MGKKKPQPKSIREFTRSNLNTGKWFGLDFVNALKVAAKFWQKVKKFFLIKKLAAILFIVIKLVLIYFLLSATFLFLIGQGQFFLSELIPLALFAIPYAFLKHYLDKEFRIEKAAAIAGVSILLIFSITQYLITIPIFFADGTNRCEDYDLSICPEKYSIVIDDLELRHEGERVSYVAVNTAVYPDEKICCENCKSRSYPKPDGTGSKKQTTSITLTVEKDVKEFSFVQQMIQYDTVSRLLSVGYVPIRACDCTADLNEAKLHCELTKNELLLWLAGTNFFQPSKCNTAHFRT